MIRSGIMVLGPGVEWCWALEAWRTGAKERPGRQGGPGGVRGQGQNPPWTKGCERRFSAVGRHFSSMNTWRTKSRAASETPSGRKGLVGCVAILKIAAMASYSAQGGFWVSISTTVHATDLTDKTLYGDRTTSSSTSGDKYEK